MNCLVCVCRFSPKSDWKPLLLLIVVCCSYVSKASGQLIFKWCAVVSGSVSGKISAKRGRVFTSWRQSKKRTGIYILTSVQKEDGYLHPDVSQKRGRVFTSCRQSKKRTGIYILTSVKKEDGYLHPDVSPKRGRVFTSWRQYKERTRIYKERTRIL